MKTEIGTSKRLQWPPKSKTSGTIASAADYSDQIHAFENRSGFGCKGRNSTESKNFIHFFLKTSFTQDTK